MTKPKNQNESFELDVQIEKLQLEKNCALVVRFKKDSDALQVRSAAFQMSQILRKYEDLRINCIFILEGLEISKMSEKDMNIAGWFRQKEKKMEQKQIQKERIKGEKTKIFV